MKKIVKKTLVKVAVPVAQAILVKVVLDQVDKKFNKSDDSDGKSKKSKKKSKR